METSFGSILRSHRSPMTRRTRWTLTPRTMYIYDALNLQGSTGETPVVLKLDGATGDVVWTYEGVASSGAVFHDVAVDLTTGWVVGAGWTEGSWVTGAAQGGYDFAAVVLDGATGDELRRFQNGTTDDDYFKFAGFDSAGGLFMGGSWTDTGQDEFVAIKFEPFEDVAPTPVDPTVAPTPVPTITPTAIALSPMTTQSPPAPSAGADYSTPAPVGRGGLPTPAPTTAAAAAAALSEWEIGAVAGGGGLLLLLLGLCLFCFRRKRPQGQQGAGKAGSSQPPPVESFGGPSAQGEILQPPPPVKASGVGEVAPPPPPAPETPLPPPAEPPLPPPPAYYSPPPPPPQVAAAETEELPPPPLYETMQPPEPAATPAETPWQRLANRVVRVPSKKTFEQNYRDISVSHYAPYAPSTTNH